MPSPRPSAADAWRMMQESGAQEWVLDHVACVEGLAIAMAEAARQNGHDVDVELVRIGAILHDIGRSITQEPKHAHLGAQWLRENGLDDAVVHMVERHTGAGLAPDDAEAIGVPRADYTPQTLEEQIVAHADNLFSANRRLTMSDVQAKYDSKRLPAAFAKIEALHEHLLTVCGVDLEAMEPAPSSRS